MSQKNFHIVFDVTVYRVQEFDFGFAKIMALMPFTLVTYRCLWTRVWCLFFDYLLKPGSIFTKD